MCSYGDQQCQIQKISESVAYNWVAPLEDALACFLNLFLSLGVIFTNIFAVLHITDCAKNSDLILLNMTPGTRTAFEGFVLCRIYQSVDVIVIRKYGVLFWRISAIYKKMWIELAGHSICTFHHNTVFVCFYKLIIKQKLPYCMDKLSFKMCLQHGGDILSKNGVKGLFNVVGKLWECSIEERSIIKMTYGLHVDKVVCCEWWWFWTLILCLISP